MNRSIWMVHPVQFFNTSSIFNEFGYQSKKANLMEIKFTQLQCLLWSFYGCFQKPQRPGNFFEGTYEKRTLFNKSTIELPRIFCKILGKKSIFFECQNLKYHIIHIIVISTYCIQIKISKPQITLKMYVTLIGWYHFVGLVWHRLLVHRLSILLLHNWLFAF